MPNIYIAIIYTSLGTLTLVNLFQSLFRSSISHKDEESRLFFFLCITTFLWYLCNVVIVLLDSIEMAWFLYHVNLVFVGFVPPFVLLFVLSFYRVPLGRFKKYTPLLFIVPTVNIFLALTYRYHSLTYAEIRIIALQPVIERELERGPWFWVHTYHSYAISFATIIIVVFWLFKAPKFYRLSAFLIACGIFVTILLNAFRLLVLPPMFLDMTLIGAGLAIIFFNYAIIRNDNSKLFRYSQAMAFNYLDIYILVMDEKEQLVYSNKAAIDYFSLLGITLDNINFNEVLEALENKGAIKKELEFEKGVDYYLDLGNGMPTVLSLCEKKIFDKTGEYIGTVGIFTDVTPNRFLIDRLEKTAGIDSLTGIANRIAYEGARKRLDTPESLPLSVIICDVNGLKFVNDNLGHYHGDRLLQMVSEMLNNTRPKTGVFARIGGDEFIYLLPLTNYEDAIKLMNKIREVLSSKNDFPYPLSVALGAATKYSDDEDLSDIISLADSRMYEDKKFIKENNLI